MNEIKVTNAISGGGGMMALSSSKMTTAGQGSRLKGPHQAQQQQIQQPFAYEQANPQNLQASTHSRYQSATLPSGQPSHRPAARAIPIMAASNSRQASSPFSQQPSQSSTKNQPSGGIPPSQVSKVPTQVIAVPPQMISSSLPSESTPVKINLPVHQNGQEQNEQQMSVSDAISCVREFVSNSHSNGVSQSVLKVRMHMTSGKGATKDKEVFNLSGRAVKDEEELHEIESIRKMVNESGELVLKNHKIAVIPRAFYKIRFDQILTLDIRGNEITAIEEAVCKNITQVRKIDARGNKIKDVSPHIKAMMMLQVLRLDSNLLEELPYEIGDLSYLEELTFSDNKVKEITPSHFLKHETSLRVLNMSDNKIKHLPQELGNLRTLKSLYIHGNRFTNFPCTFANLIKHSLEELSLEWFLYAKPPRPRIVKKGVNDGEELFEQMLVLCNLLVKYKMNECALITFLENYSTATVAPQTKEGSAANTALFNIDHVDNRIRTPLHNACVKGDVGVVEGLLLGKANANTLDKDNCTPLCLAIREDKFDSAVILINSQGVDVNLGGGIYGSPMHLAVVKLEVWIVKKLLMRGADVNKADCDGNTPMHLVMNVFAKNPQKCTNICELLITHGARANIKNNDNWAPLHVAARKGQEKGIQTVLRVNQMLKEQGHIDSMFDLNVTGGIQQWTALHLAAHGGHFQIVKDLIGGGADIFQRNNNNHLPRHCAKGNYILTKFIKLNERARARANFQHHLIMTQFELLQGLTVKQEADSSLQGAVQFHGSSGISIPHSNHNSVSHIQNHSGIGLRASISQNRGFRPHLNSHFTRKMSEATSKHSMNNSDFFIVREELDYDTFQQNLIQLKMIKTQREHDLVKRRWVFANTGGGDTDQPPSVLSDFPSGGGGKFRAIKQMPAVVSKADVPIMNEQTLENQTPKSAKNDSRFSKLNQKAEEMKKINLFYLKDLLLKTSVSHDEKLDCLWKIKRNVHKPVFAMAMKALLLQQGDFLKIRDPLIQRELLAAMGISSHASLLQPMREALQRDGDRLDEDVLDEFEDALASLQVAAGKPHSFIVQTYVDSDLKETQQLNLNGSPKKKPTLASGDKSRNVNSFKMKGMTTLAVDSQNRRDDFDMDREQILVHQSSYQVLETEVIEDNFTLPRHNLNDGESVNLHPSRQVLANMHNQAQKLLIDLKQTDDGAVRNATHLHQFSMTMVQNKPLLKAAPMPLQKPMPPSYQDRSSISATPYVYNTVAPGGVTRPFSGGDAHHQVIGGAVAGSAGGMQMYQKIINANFGLNNNHNSATNTVSQPQLQANNNNNLEINYQQPQRHNQRSSVSIPSKK